MHILFGRRLMCVETIICVLHSSVRRCQKWPARIVWGLHSSVCRHRTWTPWFFHNLRTSIYRCWPMVGTSAKALTHWLWHLCISFSLFASTNVWQHNPWHVHFGKQRFLTIDSISQSLHASAMVCVHLQCDISNDQRHEEWAKAFVLRSTEIG